jgi:hypothetical protein
MRNARSHARLLLTLPQQIERAPCELVAFRCGFAVEA